MIAYIVAVGDQVMETKEVRGVKGGDVERPVSMSLLRVSEWVNTPVFVPGKGLLGRGSNTERITLLQEYTRCLILKKSQDCY